jgi:hypothetical protein
MSAAAEAPIAGYDPRVAESGIGLITTCRARRYTKISA